MKTIQKKLTAILLCIAMLTALFVLPASAKDAQIELTKPTVTIAEAEGQTVYKLALDFTPEGTGAPMSLDCADLGKKIMLTVSFFEYGHAFGDLTLKPTSYNAATGVLTVSVLGKDGQTGFPLRDLIFRFNGDDYATCLFSLSIPEGLLESSRNRNLYNAESVFECGYLSDVTGMPTRIGADINVSSWSAVLFDFFKQMIRSAELLKMISTVFSYSALFLHLPAIFNMLRETTEYLVEFPGNDLSSVTVVDIIAALFNRIL